MMHKRLFIGVAAVAMSFWLVGCATTPYQGEGKTKSDALLATQVVFAEKSTSQRVATTVDFCWLCDAFTMQSISQ